MTKVFRSYSRLMFSIFINCIYMFSFFNLKIKDNLVFTALFSVRVSEKPFKLFSFILRIDWYF